MVLTLPYGAKPILESRMRGEKPADLVIVSLVGRVPDDNPVVIADGANYDWRWCRGLQVCIFGKVGTPNRQVAIEIGRCLPAKLFLWDVEAKHGTDVITHIRTTSLDKRADELKASDWAAMLWPWSEWQNKQFMGE